MFVLHVDLLVSSDNRVKVFAPDEKVTLERTFCDLFCPAIAKQSGFLQTSLLRSNEDSTQYRLVIAFDTHEHQQQWAKSDLHAQVWPKMAEFCTSYLARQFEQI